MSHPRNIISLHFNKARSLHLVHRPTLSRTAGSSPFERTLRTAVMRGNAGAINSAAWCKCLDKLDGLPEGKRCSRVPCVLSAGERWTAAPLCASAATVPGLMLIRAVSVQTRHCMREITCNYVGNKVIWHHIYLFTCLLILTHSLKLQSYTSSCSVRVTTSVSGMPNLTAGPSVSSFPSVGVCVCVCICPYSSHSNPSIWLSVSLCPAHGRHCWGHTGWCSSMLSDDLQPLKHILLLWNLPLIIIKHFSLGGTGRILTQWRKTAEAKQKHVAVFCFVLLGRLFFRWCRPSLPCVFAVRLQRESRG